MHVNHLASILSRADEDSAKLLCERIDEKIDYYASGALDHAVDAITLLWKLSKASGRPLPVAPDEKPEKSENPEEPGKPVSASSLFLPTKLNPYPRIAGKLTHPSELDACRDRIDQIDSQRSFLRQKVLDETFKNRGRITTYLHFKRCDRGTDAAHQRS